MKIHFTLLLTFIFISFSLVSAGTQSIRAVGRLMCRGKPAQYAELQLVNVRGGKDNILIGSPVVTDPNGYFDVFGTMHQFYEIPAAVHIWHECFYDIGIHHGACKSLLKITTPKQYVNEGVVPAATWELGRINLEEGVFKEHLDRCD